MSRNLLASTLPLCPMVMEFAIGSHVHGEVVVPSIQQRLLVRLVQIGNIQEGHCDLNNLMKIFFAHIITWMQFGQNLNKYNYLGRVGT